MVLEIAHGDAGVEVPRVQAVGCASSEALRYVGGPVVLPR